MRKALSLFLAAFLMTGAASYVRAEDDTEITDDAEYMIVIDDDIDADDDSPSYGRPHWGGPGRGMMPRHMMHDGPGFHRGMGPGMGKGFGPHDGPHDGPGIGPRGPRGMDGMGMHRFMDLDLTDAQKTQLVDILTDNYKQSLEARFALIDAKKALGDVYDQDNPDQAAIVSAHEALGAATGRMAALKRGNYDRIKSILTPEQVEKLDSPRKGDRRDRPDRLDRPGRKDRPDRMDRSDRPGKPGMRDRDGRGPRHGGPKR